MPGINEVNYFPDFTPMKAGDEKWEMDATHCFECHEEFHIILKRPQHCTVCGTTFCGRCCHNQKIYNGNPSCGSCVANANIIIKNRYDQKRTAQLKAHHDKYHHDEAAAKEAKDVAPASAMDDLYGRAYEALLVEGDVQVPEAPSTRKRVDIKNVGVNEVNFFPVFTPVVRGDEKWETEEYSHCPECKEEFHPVLNRSEHCAVCGMTFCGRCCRPQRVYNNHRSCGGCVASGMMMIKTRYDAKRTAQLKAHHEKYHAADAKTKASEMEVEAPHTEMDDLYGRAYEALMAEETKKTGTAVDHHVVNSDGVTDVNFFPEFHPMDRNDSRWEAEAGSHCPGCKNEYHVLTHRATHCTVCGTNFCHHCAHTQKVYNGHVACTACTASAMIVIKKRYEEKRAHQLQMYSNRK